jgi:plasmid stability protein
MATITLKNVPDDLHRRLKERAERHHRSLNREAIRCLEEAVADERIEEQALLARIRANRARMVERGVWLTEESLLEATEEGRP